MFYRVKPQMTFPACSGARLFSKSRRLSSPVGDARGGGGLKWTNSMAFNGLARLTRKRDAGPPSLPSGARIYAVGDIHGRLDLLDALAEQIRADLVSAPPEVMTIFLGDYVDRGPASAGVLDRLSHGDLPCESTPCGATTRKPS